MGSDSIKRLYGVGILQARTDANPAIPKADGGVGLQRLGENRGTCSYGNLHVSKLTTGKSTNRVHRFVCSEGARIKEAVTSRSRQRGTPCFCRTTGRSKVNTCSARKVGLRQVRGERAGRSCRHHFSGIAAVEAIDSSTCWKKSLLENALCGGFRYVPQCVLL